MPSGRWPESIGQFRKWATDQVNRGNVAGNKATSSRGRKWRMSRKRRKKSHGFQD